MPVVRKRPAKPGVPTARHDADEAVRVADLDPGRGLLLAEAAARRARREGDAAAAAVAERAWGHCLLHCGEMDAAIRHLRRAVAAGEDAASPVLAAEARMKLAYALMQRGRPRDALREVDGALEVLDGAPGARARAQRAIVLHESGRLDESLAEYRLALPVLRREGDQLGLQKMLINRGFLQAHRHAFAAAEADLVEAEGLARRLGRTLTVGLVAENLALVETLRGDVPAALAHLRRAEEISTAHGAQLGIVHRDRAELLLSVGVVSEAREAAEQAIEAFRREHRRLKLSETRLLLAQAAHLDRDWAGALDQARRARREFLRQNRPEWAGLALLAQLRVELAAGSPVRRAGHRVATLLAELPDRGWPYAAVEARLVAARLARGPARAEVRRAHLTEATRIAGPRGPATLRARGRYARAELRAASGDRPGALRAARAGLRILDEHVAVVGATDIRARAAVHRTELAEFGLRIALEQGRPAGVLEWAERSRSGRLRQRPVRPSPDPELAALLSELRAAATEADQLAEQGRRSAAAHNRQAAIERRIRDHSRLHRSSAGSEPDPVRAGVLGAALGDRALVEFVAVDGTLHALTVSGDRLRLRAVGPVAEVAGLVAQVSFALHRLARLTHARSGAAHTLLRAATERLDTLLLGAHPPDRPLVVVPTGPLHDLAWAALPSCAGRPVSVCPSATLWHAIHARTAEPGGVGSGRGESVRAEPGRGVVVAAGPGLPGAREEAIAVAAVHGVRPLLDGDAGVAAVLDGLGTAGLAHLAAHGRLARDNPQFSDLLLGDGPLVVHDLERLDRVPETVVLAACDTGRSVVHAGDELLGLSAAFVARGAARLIAPVVPVPDGETGPLMVDLHRRLAAGQPPAGALADAQAAGEVAASGFVCLGHGG